MRTLLLAGAALGVLMASPALAQGVSVGPPGYRGGYYGGHWGYGHSYGYGPVSGWFAPYYDGAPLVRVGYPWGPTYQTRSGHAAYIENPVRVRYVPPVRSDAWWWR